MLPPNRTQRRDHRRITHSKGLGIHQQNVKTSPGPPRGVMVPLVLLVHPDPPGSTFSVKFQKVWIRMDWSGPGGPRGLQPPLVDQEGSGAPWTTLRHFPDAPISYNLCDLLLHIGSVKFSREKSPKLYRYLTIREFTIGFPFVVRFAI